MSIGTLAGAVRSLGHTLAALTTNCHDFQMAWDQAANEDQDSSSLAGRWEGEWISDANAHHGALRGVLRPLGPNRYRASFHASYAGVLRACYCMDLAVEGESWPVQLQGEADLGRLGGGVYQYDGHSDGQTLVCTYRCAYDRGSFTLQKRNHSVPS